MSNVFSYEGNNVTMRLENGVVFVNLTEVAKAFPSKNLTQIINSKEVQEYASKLATKLQIYSLADLVQVTRGGDGSHGTWAHQRVALRVAQKLSTDFAIWVDEKIEELLTTGKTSIQQRVPTNKELALMVIQAEEEKERLMLENKAQQEQIEKQRPAVVFTNAVQAAVNSCLVGELAKILQQNGIDMGEKRLFKWLREHKYLGSHGERYNIPNQEYIERGYFELKKGTRSGDNGVMHTTITTKVTGKGQVYFVNKFLSMRERKEELV